ncbi:tetratricopeptide repeat protein [Pseudooceanicola sp.]|uniref:tetratricopeptide repeat protein n=1 Tax=Pseudooceanicola sp. TaxID=1914328 RepID=UPI0035124C67
MDMFGNSAARMRLAGRAVVFGCALLALASCRPDAEVAAEHEARAMAFLEEGDGPRARVEFMNALNRQPNRVEARLGLAKLLRDSGDRTGAYAHYKRVLDQVPDHLPSLLALSEIAMLDRNWDAARLYVSRAATLAGADPQVSARQAVLDYAEAAKAEDAARRDDARARLLALRGEATEFLPLHHVLVDGFMRDGDPEAALGAVDIALTEVPRDQYLHTARLQLLYELERTEEIAPQFARMIEIFPESLPLRQSLSDWHAGRGDLDAAEAALREMTDPPTTEAQMALVRFLVARRGADVALQELEGLVGSDESSGSYRLLRAAIRYDAGDAEAAIADVREAVRLIRENGGDATEAHFLLAQMLDGSNLRTEAEAALRSLLTDRPRHVPAAQLLASWLMERGQPEPALRLLNVAQTADPDNPQTLNLLARALSATGSRELARQTQARAFEASGYLPEQAQYYALLLAEAGNTRAAVEVLTTALQRAPGSEVLLVTLGDHYRISGEWDDAAAIETRLEALGTPAARLAAERIRFDRMAAESDIALALDYLEQGAGQGGSAAATYASIARANLASGRTDRARQVLDRGLARYPEDRDLRAAAAAVALAMQDPEKAAELYAGLVAEAPGLERVWIELFRLRQRQGDAAAAGRVLDAALKANPGSDLLLWEAALHHQGQGEADRAIATYEVLLSRHPQSAPVRNNLASLLSTRGDGRDDLDRAEEVAAPLAGSPVPQFLDTYGWIQFRRNAFEPAAAALREAARGLPNDPAVQFHAAEALAAIGRNAEARTAYAAVLRLAGADTPLGTQAQARLDAVPAGPGAGN